MSYPDVLNEFETLERIEDGAGCIRFGDGEFWIMEGRNNTLQCYAPDLAAELTRILHDPPPGVLMCIPRLNNLPPASPARSWWAAMIEGGFPPIPPGVYGSSLITRPDSAPWTLTKGFRERVTALWRGKRVTVVSNPGRRGFTPNLLAGARACTFIETPERHAWETHKTLDVGKPDILLVACGPLGKVLADRRAREGGRVLDLGHLGMFFNQTLAGEGAHDPGDEGNDPIPGRGKPVKRVRDPQSGAWIPVQQ